MSFNPAYMRRAAGMGDVDWTWLGWIPYWPVAAANYAISGEFDWRPASVLHTGTTVLGSAAADAGKAAIENSGVVLIGLAVGVLILIVVMKK